MGTLSQNYEKSVTIVTYHDRLLMNQTAQTHVHVLKDILQMEMDIVWQVVEIE
jgi:hypothetical protein